MPSLFGLSPLTTAHRSIFQHTPVRASTKFYFRFTLTMVSSPGFVSTPSHLLALFRLAFAPAPAVTALTLSRLRCNSLVHSPKGTPSRIPPYSGIALRLIVGTQFQILFHSAHRRSFHLSLTVLVHYRSPNVFSLGWWSTRIPTRFLVPRGTQDTRQSQSSFAYGTVTLCGLPFQIVLLDN